MASAAGARRSTSSSLAKRHASASENLGKVAPSSAAAAKKRPALTNITNQRHASGSLNTGRASMPESSKIVRVTLNSLIRFGFVVQNRGLKMFLRHEFWLIRHGHAFVLSCSLFYTFEFLSSTCGGYGVLKCSISCFFRKIYLVSVYYLLGIYPHIYMGSEVYKFICWFVAFWQIFSFLFENILPVWSFIVQDWLISFQGLNFL